MCPLEHEWPAIYKVEAPLRVGSDSTKLKRRYGLAFEKFRDIRDIYRAPNRMSGLYTIILNIDEPSI